MNILNSKDSNIGKSKENRDIEKVEEVEKTSRGEWKKTRLSDSSKNNFGAPLLGDSRDLFRPKTSDIPNQPGVYKWRDERGKVIYVGKAKSLRDRLVNYFQPLNQLHPRTQSMVLTARSLEWTVVNTELEALTLEYTWIKEFNPRFNVVFKDDKTYPYIAVSVNDDFPRVWITRNRNSKSTRYFGPYAKVWQLKHSLDSLLKTFPVRTCRQSVFNKAHKTGRPCLLASIGKCSAPCVQKIDSKTHRDNVEQLVGILTGAIGDSYINDLTKQMKDLSNNLDFEGAAKIRDKINIFKTVIQQNSVVFNDQVEADVFGFSADSLEACVHAFFVREGLLRGEKNWQVERSEDISDADIIANLLVKVYCEYEPAESKISFSKSEDVEKSNSLQIQQSRNALQIDYFSYSSVSNIDSSYRARKTKERKKRQETTGRGDLLDPICPIPREIIVPIELERVQKENLENWLSDLRGSKVTIRVAERGDKRSLMDKANLNAAQSLKQMKISRISTLEARTNAMNQVAAALSMSESPLRIECYDISNSADGKYQVASMVVFEDGVANPSEYRRFSIKGKDGLGQLDDLSALYETISRRFKHKDDSNGSGENNSGENNKKAAVKKFAYKPNLVIVDGGIEQAKAAKKAMIDSNVKGITVCGLSKKLEEVWLPDNQYPIILKRSSEGLYLLQRARDESHRFAITYHRQKRAKAMLHSSIDSIPGVGESYKKRLISKFGSVKNIKEASVEDLQKVPGIGLLKAKTIYKFLHSQSS